LPKKSSSFRITSAYIEFLHDEGIALVWPGVQPVGRQDCIDLNLLESASRQPFQGGFGQDFYPTIYDKAACLFFSLAGGHIFNNGNKRTAVLAVDQFLDANGIYLNLSNDEIREIAISTASYRLRNEDHQTVKAGLSAAFQEHSFQFKDVRKTAPAFYKRLLQLKRLIRRHPLNQVDAKPKQLH
jgi:death on curing protein